MCLRDKIPSVGLKGRMVTEDVKKNWLRWRGCVLWKDYGNWVKRCMLYEADGLIARGRPGMTRNQVAEKDMRKCGLNEADAEDQVNQR